MPDAPTTPVVPDAVPDPVSAASPSTSRAVFCIGGSATRMGVQDRPDPGPGEILLAMVKSGLCGTDLFKLQTGTAPTNGVLGHEIVGTIAALGTGVDRFSIGDRIVVPHHVACGTCLLCRRGNETMCPEFKINLMAPGGFADHILIAARAVSRAAFRIPDHVSDEQAVFVEPAACVLRGIDRSGIGPDGRAAILGSGSMGLLHLLVLKAAFPACRVLVVDPEPDRLDLAKRLGADAVAAPGTATAEAGCDLTDSAGLDAVFDTVGGNGTLEAGIDLLRPGGTLVLFAHAGDGEAAQFDLNAVFKAEKRIIATYSGGLADQRRVFDMICAGDLDPTPLVTHTLPLDDFQRGVDLTRQREALKVLYTPSVSPATNKVPA